MSVDEKLDLILHVVQDNQNELKVINERLGQVEKKLENITE